MGAFQPLYLPEETLRQAVFSAAFVSLILFRHFSRKGDGLIGSFAELVWNVFLSRWAEERAD